MTAVFFCLSSLDIMDALDKLSKDRRAEIIDWIYAQQVTPRLIKKTEAGVEDLFDLESHSGFIGGSFTGVKHQENAASDVYSAHIAMTYTALACLAILGDDFSKVNRKAITTALKSLQQKDGSFAATATGSESGMRFVYCACVISHILNDWSGVDKDKVVQFVLNSQSYDGGIGLLPGQESHGGSTFCAVASMHLMGRMHQLPMKQKLLRFCLLRQHRMGGFQGRRNKDADTCYSFWFGATIKLLGHFDLVDHASILMFHKTCEKLSIGGFGKVPQNQPDILHSFFSICAMSLMTQKGFRELSPSLCMSRRAELFLKQLNSRTD